MKMVQWCETAISHSLCLRQALVFMCLCALSSSNYIHPVVECDSPDEFCEDITALDFGEQSPQVRNLKQLVGTTLDERTLLAFPVQRDGYIERVNIAKEIWDNHSEEFGVALLGIERLAVIDEIINKNPETANVRILWQWLNGKGRKPVTFRTLIDVLREIGFNEIANTMATTCKILKIMDVHYKPALAKDYSQRLSGKYEGEFVIDNMQWLPKRFHGRNIAFVDLELKEKGSNILLFDLLGDIQSGARILFVGRPGVGKTTIMRHLSKAWIHTERFYLIIKLHLGVTGRINSLDTLLQANADESFDSSDINVIASYINKTLGEGICFLLDGFDEYDGSDYVESLIQGNKLAKSVVIVTSRPNAAEDIETFFHRKVEIIGFGEKGIQTYLEQLELSQDEYLTIYQYLDTHPNVRQLCYLPLHLSMLVYVAVDTKDSSTLSLVDTETELYTDFLFLTIKQYESVRHERTVKSLKDCFDDIYENTDLCVLLRKICKNAFDGVMSREQTFTSSSFDGLPDRINISAEIEALSLFKVETFYDRRGNKLNKYYYSHPTFQEFFAAFHLATFPRKEQLLYIKYFWMHEVYKFFLGLIGSELKYDDETVSQAFVSFAREELATYQRQELYVMRCAHEVSRGSQFITYLQAVGVITNSNSVHVYAHYNHDCWYVGYTLAQSPLHKLIVDKYSELPLCISFITNYLKHDPKVLGSVNVTELTFGNYESGYWPWFTDREDPISTAEILDLLPAFQNDLTHLELTFLKFEHSASISHLGEILMSFRKLQFLALSVNISVIKEGHLESALRDLAHLKHLEVGIINKHDDDTAIPDDLLEFKSLKQLQSLTLCISWNKDLVDVNMTALIGGLECLTALESLTIRIILYNGFRDNGATELSQGLQKVSSINDLVLHLDLCWELGLGNITTKELAAALRDLTIMKNLSLCIDFNFSGIPGTIGVIELAEGLKHLTTELQELSLELRWELQTNDAIDEAAIALAEGLKHLHSLSALELNLKQNGSCSEIVSLFKSLTQLQELKLGWKSPGGKTDVMKLINGLQHLKQLRQLIMSWNSIGDDDVVPLIEALKHMNHLHTLDLSHNEIGDAGLKLLAEAIESLHLSHLQVLLLNDNKFSDVGAKILSEKVVTLSQLHTLEFDLSLGAYSAQALVRINEQKTTRKTVPSSNKLSNETCIFMLYSVTPFITLGISALVGGLICCIAFKSSPVLTNEASSKRNLPPKGISETLALGIFSTSSAWKLERLRNQGLDGSGTVIVLLDTAVDLHCPAFHQKNIPIIDCLPQLPCASIEHGSVCAAVAVGFSYHNSPSTIVPSGVAPGAQLIVYRVAEGEYCYNEAVLRALDDMKEKTESGTQIDVVSISYDFSEDNEEEIRRKIKTLTEKGVVFVAAAGNRGRYQARASIPACFDSVISVGALDRNGFQSRFNACGRIDVFAPGEDIPTPSPSSLFWGTSFATPAVSGLVSLLKQCASKVGPPASNYIHDVEILRSIFNRHMITRSDSGQVDVFDPVGFFLRVIGNPNLLNEIVAEHLNTEFMEQ